MNVEKLLDANSSIIGEKSCLKYAEPRKVNEKVRLFQFHKKYYSKD